ncbi:hypothetical protein HWV62_34619 [Athelia sp. TMB]|nr:hypothetical protein HWV62_34619 [Athelia sp. TMB]
MESSIPTPLTPKSSAKLLVQDIDDWLEQMARWTSSSDGTTSDSSPEDITPTAESQESQFEGSRESSQLEEAKFKPAAGITPHTTLIYPPHQSTVGSIQSIWPSAQETPNRTNGQSYAHAHWASYSQPTLMPQMQYQPPPYPPPYHALVGRARNPATAEMVCFDVYRRYQAPYNGGLVPSDTCDHMQTGPMPGPSRAPTYQPLWNYTTSRSDGSSVSPSTAAPPTSDEMERPFPCLIPECNFRMSEKEIGRHITTHYRTPLTNGTAAVHCEVPGCKKPGPYSVACMGRHVKNHYPEDLLGVGCERCGCRLSRGDSLRRHYLHVHKVELPKGAKGRRPGTRVRTHGPYEQKSPSRKPSEAPLGQTWRKPYSSQTFRVNL